MARRSQPASSPAPSHPYLDTRRTADSPGQHNCHKRDPEQPAKGIDTARQRHTAESVRRPECELQREIL